MTTVRGKTAIITGGVNGIGFKYCQQLLINGVKAVAILDLPSVDYETAVRKLNEEFGADRALFFPADVTKHDELEVAFGKAVEALKGLDILINNAGILNDRLWQREIDINFTGVVKSTLLGYDYMGKHKGGKGGIIVNVASVAGLIPFDIIPVYTATKYAVVAFTISLKAHYERTGISVRVMCPGVTDTPLITEAHDKYLSFLDKTKAHETLSTFYRQPAENVAKSMIPLIEKGTNGSVWVSQFSEAPFEFEIPKYEGIDPAIHNPSPQSS